MHSSIFTDVYCKGTGNGEKNTKGDVVIPSDIKYVSPGAFDNNEDITSVVFPSNIKKLNDSTFFYCNNLKSADLRYAQR